MFFFRRRCCFFVVCFWLLGASVAFTAVGHDRSRIIRVGLTHLGSPGNVKIEPSAGFIEVFDSAKNSVVFAGPAKHLQVRPHGTGLQVLSNKGDVVAQGGPILVFSPVGRPPNHLKIHGDKRGNSAFRGSIEIRRQSRDSLSLINIVDIDDYLKGVLPCEMWVAAPAAAHEAQAIAARSYLLHNRNRHASSGYDVCDRVHCQVYRGMLKETTRSSRAVVKTSGIVLEHGGAPINAVYHSNCGGFLLSSKTAWGGKKVPYLIAHQDSLPGLPTFCEVGRNARRKKPVPAPLTTMPKLIIRTRSDAQRNVAHAHYGHRVGLCQDGAIGMAILGFPANYIVAFYYPGSRLASIDRLPRLRPSASPMLIVQRPGKETLTKSDSCTESPSSTQSSQIQHLASVNDSPLTLVKADDALHTKSRSVKDTLAALRRRTPAPGPTTTEGTARVDAFRKWFWCTMPPHAFARAPKATRFTREDMVGSISSKGSRKDSTS